MLTSFRYVACFVLVFVRSWSRQSDETVEVGADLYVIDTEGVASVQSAPKDAPATASGSETETPVAAATDSATPESSTTTAASSSSSQSRAPSIHFLGKNGWAARRAGKPAAPKSLIPDTPNGVVLLDGSMITAAYGRPAFSEEEMEALISGGASIAPTVVSLSSGAKFSA